MTLKMKILLLDNYDSFTYNLLHAVKELGATDVEVVRNDQIELDEVDRFDKIILSPGPGIPEEAGLLLPIIKRYAPTKSILGVCLGHQAIGEAFGARLENLKEVYHGVQTPITILHQDLLFEGLGKGVESLLISLIRYLVVLLPLAFLFHSRFHGSFHTVVAHYISF